MLHVKRHSACARAQNCNPKAAVDHAPLTLILHSNENIQFTDSFFYSCLIFLNPFSRVISVYLFWMLALPVRHVRVTWRGAAWSWHSSGSLAHMNVRMLKR